MLDRNAGRDDDETTTAGAGPGCREIASMESQRERLNREGQRELPSWVGVAKFVLLVFFAGMIFLLGQSMVRHQFFSGGGLDYRQSSSQQ